jgi:hypothetical protein
LLNCHSSDWNFYLWRRNSPIEKSAAQIKLPGCKL